MARKPIARRGRLILTVGILAASLAGQMSPAAAGSPAADVPVGSPEADDPCDGLFALMDRPTVADSACAVKPGHLLTELGYQNGPIKGTDTGNLAFFPQASLRYGLPDGWEARLFPPNINMSDIRAAAGGGHLDGFGDTAFGVKRQFGTFGGFTVAADARLIAPTGNQAFSGGGVQGNIQGIVSYNLTPQLGVLFLLGGSSLTARVDDGHVARFGSLNSSFVVSYQVSDQLQLFSEVFANSMTAPSTRGNCSYLSGAQLLLTKSIEFDVEAGVLLTGPQGVQSHFFGIGTGLQF